MDNIFSIILPIWAALSIIKIKIDIPALYSMVIGINADIYIKHEVVLDFDYRRSAINMCIVHATVMAIISPIALLCLKSKFFIPIDMDYLRDRMITKIETNYKL